MAVGFAVILSIAHHCHAQRQRTYLKTTAVEINGAVGGVLSVAAYKSPQKHS